MILYLSSQKFGNNIKFLSEWLKKHDKKILLITNALDDKEDVKIHLVVEEDVKLLKNIGFDVRVVDLKKYFGNFEDLRKEFLKYSAFCVVGGNVFVLRQAMKYSGFDIFLKEAKNSSNYLYVGYSAGSCVLCNDLEIYKNVDSPVNIYKNEKVIFKGLGLINYTFIPHYKSGYHKDNIIVCIVTECLKLKRNFKTLTDGEVIIEKI